MPACPLPCRGAVRATTRTGRTTGRFELSPGIRAGRFSLPRLPGESRAPRRRGRDVLELVWPRPRSPDRVSPANLRARDRVLQPAPTPQRVRPWQADPTNLEASSTSRPVANGPCQGQPLGTTGRPLAMKALAMSHVLDAALDYSRIGLTPVPLAPGERRPTARGWNRPRGTSPGALRLAFAGDRNVGLLMGRGLFALDVDVKRAGEGCLRRWLGKRTLPPTAEAVTPSGGRHLLFRVPGADVRSHTGAGELAPGIDVIGTGGQIVAEPSSVGGREYVWVRHPAHGIAPAPRWLVRELRAKESASAVPPAALPAGPDPDGRASGAAGTLRPGDRETLLADAVRRFPVAAKGTRDSHYFRLVASLVGREYDNATVAGVALDWWQYHYKRGLCSPPDPAHVRSQLRSARRAQEQGRIRPSAGAGHRLALSRLVLTPAQEEALDRLCSPLLLRGENKRGTAPQERAFLAALLLHAVHERGVHGGPEIRATNQQLLDLMGERFGLDLEPSQLRRLKAKFITRTDGQGVVTPASKVELLAELVRGSRAPGERAGRPSVYRPSESLLALLELGTGSESAPEDHSEVAATVEEPCASTETAENATGAEPTAEGNGRTEDGPEADGGSGRTRAEAPASRAKLLDRRGRTVPRAAHGRRDPPEKRAVGSVRPASPHVRWPTAATGYRKPSGERGYEGGALLLTRPALVESYGGCQIWPGIAHDARVQGRDPSRARDTQCVPAGFGQGMSPRGPPALTAGTLASQRFGMGLSTATSISRRRGRVSRWSAHAARSRPPPSSAAAAERRAPRAPENTAPLATHRGAD